MVKITTFNDRPVRHVRFMPDGTVILKLYERRPNRRARHLRVSLAQRWDRAPKPGNSPGAVLGDEKAAVFGTVSNRE